jgi:hypothetical protein
VVTDRVKRRHTGKRVDERGADLGELHIAAYSHLLTGNV